MARKVVVELQDDIDGTEADTTVSFGYEGKNYEIDLNEKNAKKLESALATYIGHARRVGTAKARVVGRASGTSDVDPKAVRAWASSNGYEVSTRGRVSADLVAAFKAAGN